jgi:membrane-associated HD superfamily phosphohydrolase
MLLISLADVFLVPNIAFDKAETEARKARARAGVETVFYTVKKGKVIVRKGDEVTAEAAKQVRLFNLELGRRPSWFSNFAGTFLLFALLFITLWYYLKSILRSGDPLKKFVMMGTTLFLSLILFRLSLFLADGLSGSASVSIFATSDVYLYASLSRSACSCSPSDSDHWPSYLRHPEQPDGRLRYSARTSSP